ncbi:hypothetical protein Aoki45_12940 [Algoriphagus sp. oki45]|uniref:efflux RND transporter periplasmic adaptor subunit n=1 Tax=Algoriphagus sp. oki45 TaxID=3067294 RepID=UPI0027F0B820|nr:hypothetical protein Aoki45_12940 [Algoriphagus sp. oki45]
MKSLPITPRFFLLPALGVSMLFSCGEKESSQDEGIQVTEVKESKELIFLSNTQFSTMEMEWGSIKTGDFSSQLTVQGTVKIPVEGMQEISAYFGGYVSDLTLIEGQAVRQGQVLFNLENPDFVRLQQDYLETSSQLDYLKAEYERQKTLFAEQISAQKNLLKAEADYRGALAKSQGLKKQLSLIRISADQLTPETIRSKVPVVSPINGFVEEVHVVPGQFLPASGKAISLLNKDHLHIELVLFEKDAASVYIGQKLVFSLPDQTDQVYEAEIHVVGQTVNEQRQINVHADLVDESLGKNLIPGMFVQARINLDTENGWSLPEEAITEVDGKYFILIQKSKTEEGYELEQIEVSPGAPNQGMISIQPVQGMTPETKILVKGGFNLM